MFRTSKFSSSGRLVHAVLCYLFQASIQTFWSMAGSALYIYIYIYVCVCVCVCVCVKVNGKDYQAHPAIDQTAYMDA